MQPVNGSANEAGNAKRSNQGVWLPKCAPMYIVLCEFQTQGPYTEGIKIPVLN